MSKQLKRTPASQWGQNTELVELPSGKVAEFKRLNILTMIRRGGDDIPNFLKVYIAQSLQGQTVDNPMKDIKDPSEGVEAILFLAKRVFVYPKLVDGECSSDDEVCIDDVSTDDLSTAAGYGLGNAGVVQQLEDFRKDAEADVESLPAE